MTTHPIPEPRQPLDDAGVGGLEGFSVTELSFIWRQLDASQREFITLYYQRARKLHKQATDAWNKRAARIAYLIDYCAANKYNEYQTRQKIINDWTFTDANDDWLRFLREIRRCEAAINMELKASIIMPVEARRVG